MACSCKGVKLGSEDGSGGDNGEASARVFCLGCCLQHRCCVVR